MHPHKDVVCSGFSIAPGVYITAHHCLDEGLPMINGEATTVIAEIPEYDLAVLETTTTHPVLSLGLPPQRGTPVVALGWVFNPPILVARRSHVMMFMKVSGEPKMIYDVPNIQGMSGGPIVNDKGQVVGVVQASNGRVALSLMHEDLVRLTGEYWQSQ